MPQPDPLARLERAATRRRVDPELRASVFARDGNRCIRCGSTERLGLDHIVPVSKGGTDSEENLRVLCLGCNSAKGNRSDEKYLQPLAPDAQERLEELLRAQSELAEADKELFAAMVDARKQGFSYAEIGRAVGVTRQSVRERLTRG